jgi:predicted phosphodiesterase
MRIAVISDIHGAAKPFAQALVDARKIGFDQLVLLGDLLTYGTEPELCLDLARKAIVRDRAIFVGGNHDQLYRALGEGVSHYADHLPQWIRESIFWTMENIGHHWPPDIEWVENWSCGPAFFAHANPFGFGNWTYLSDPAHLDRAARALAERGMRFGIFGHSHRPLTYHLGNVSVHVVPSIGQPRSNEFPLPQWTMVDLEETNLTITGHSVAFDPEAHRQGIQGTLDLSQNTRDTLCRYFQ